MAVFKDLYRRDTHVWDNSPTNFPRGHNDKPTSHRNRQPGITNHAFSPAIENQPDGPKGLLIL